MLIIIHLVHTISRILYAMYTKLDSNISVYRCDTTIIVCDNNYLNNDR